MNITISPEQYAKLGQANERYFVERMIRDLAERFPDRCARATPDQLRNLVRFGMERSGRQGVEREREIKLWLYLMMVLGPHFDADPDLPWVQAVLTDPGLYNPIHKMHRLYEHARKRLAEGDHA